MSVPPPPVSMVPVPMAVPAPIAPAPPPGQVLANINMLLDKNALPITFMIPIIFSIIMLVLSFILSIYYLILLLILVVQQSATASPLNNQTVDFETIKSLSLFGSGQFKYKLFILLPLAAIFGIIAFGIMIVFFPPKVPIPRKLKGIIAILMLSAVMVFVIQSLVISKIGGSITTVKKRLDLFNTYVCSKIYVNPSFLENIRNPQGSIISSTLAIQKSLSLLKPDMDSDTLAQAFFTLTLFHHYQKIGMRNPTIFEAFNIFDTSNLMIARLDKLSKKSKCNPADYLTRYGTYIEDISESTLRYYLPKEMSGSMEVEKAFVTCNEWITNANGYANTIYPEDAFSSFVVLAIITFLVQLIPLFMIKNVYSSEPSTSKRFFDKVLETLGLGEKE